MILSNLDVKINSSMTLHILPVEFEYEFVFSILLIQEGENSHKIQGNTQINVLLKKAFQFD